MSWHPPIALVEFAMSRRPKFLITVDTEGDDLWSRPRTITTRNAGFLPRFQSLCGSYGLKPTYLVNYEMAISPVFREFGRHLLARQAAEIGMHLHAWNTPPLVPLTPDDLLFQPYLIEYPESVLRQKVALMTDLLEATFGVKMISHRAGRWSFDETYARTLVGCGYRVDCSVTPFVSWAEHRGDPHGRGGTDFSQFPSEPYFIDLDAVSRPGDSPLLEIPMTIVPFARLVPDWLRARVNGLRLGRRIMNRFLPPVRWLRPDRRNRDALVGLLRRAVREQRFCIEFMVHSSELMPGGSPLFPRREDVERLYARLEVLFAVARESCVGATLRECYEQLATRRAAAVG